MSAQDVGAQEFIDAVWPNGELYIEEEEIFKKALGGGPYKNRWLLKPSVLKDAARFFKSYGMSTADVLDKKTQTLGGTFVVLDGEVVFSHQETTTFDNGDARELLAAVLKKDVADVPAVPTTPQQADEAACERK